MFGEDIRVDFPIFKGSERLAYLDTAASSQKPQCVIDCLCDFLSHSYANIHRGAYSLSMKATERYEEARSIVAKFINAEDADNIAFTKGATEGLNLITHALEDELKAGDYVLLSELEHHANLVPWQMLVKRKGIKLAFAKVDDNGSLDLNDMAEKIKTFKPKIVSCTYISNAFGSVYPIAEIASHAHKAGALMVLDAAQAAAHIKLDVQKLDIDLAAFSGHKAYGPTGIGVLYGKAEVLDRMQPFLGGGDMIEKVTLDGFTYIAAPGRFEAGTPPIAEAVALGEALNYLMNLGMDNIERYEEQLFNEAWQRLSKEDGLTLYGPANVKKPQTSIISFNLEGVHPFDLATVMDDFSVQIRVGHHCAMPAMERFGLSATARLSLGIYSSMQDIEQLIEAINYAKKLFL